MSHKLTHQVDIINFELIFLEHTIVIKTYQLDRRNQV
jgi:hypothetical protein